MKTSYNTLAIRQLLNAVFDDEGLTIFCFDHFRSAYDKFSSGMSRSSKIQLLIEYCEQYVEFDKLLAQVKEINPKQYQIFRPRIENLSETSNPDTLADKSQTEIILRGDLSKIILTENETSDESESLIDHPKFKPITDELNKLLATNDPSSSIGDTKMTTPEQQIFAIGVLTQAVSFLFDEARKILAERRERRQKMEDPDDTTALPDNVQESAKEKILELKPANFDEKTKKEIDHLLKLIAIQQDHRRKAEFKINKMGGILFVPPNVRIELESAEDELLNHTQKLKKLLEKVYNQPIHIDGLG